MISNEAIRAALIPARRARLREKLAGAPFDAVIATTAANVDYAGGYRSVAAGVHGSSAISVLLTSDLQLMVGPVAESAPAFDAGLVEGDFLAYGRFYFESEGDSAEPSRLVNQHDGYAEALEAAVRRAGLAQATIGLDEGGLTSELTSQLMAALPEARWVDASVWLSGVRARKLPGELELLTRSARLAEKGIVEALGALTPGTTERELAAIVSGVLVAGGAEPRFTVVTAGERSALADAYSTERPIRPGDLVRFDVGGMLEGYWSDIGRTAVLGEPTPRQLRFYDAIKLAEEEEIAFARPGLTGERIFDHSISVVEKNGGPIPYRRQHCGHGIGLTTYESVIIRPGEHGVLAPGMVFCFETPYYELGWGGMMVEDALVITESGAQRLTNEARGLTVIPA